MKKVALVLGLALAASFVLAGCSASETGGAGDPVPDGVTEPGVTPNGNEIEASQPANQVQDTEEKLELDKMPMVMVDGKLYYDTGEESSIDGLGGVFRVPGESVGILAECVHVLAVAYQLFDFALWQRLDHTNKGVPQFVN